MAMFAMQLGEDLSPQKFPSEINSPLRIIPKCDIAKLCPFLLISKILRKNSTGLLMNGLCLNITALESALLDGVTKPSAAMFICPSGALYERPRKQHSAMYSSKSLM